MLSLGLKKVFKCLKFDLKKILQIPGYTMVGLPFWVKTFFNKPFLTILLGCFENVL